jgi:hypothetical protein
MMTFDDSDKVSDMSTTSIAISKSSSGYELDNNGSTSINKTISLLRETMEPNNINSNAKDNAVTDEHQQEPSVEPGFDPKKERLFYICYRISQKLSGLLWGITDSGASGYYIGMKWGGSGGFVAGAVAQIIGMTIPTVVGCIYGGIVGLFSDRYVVSDLARDYRYSVGSGGLPPTF